MSCSEGTAVTACPRSGGPTCVISLVLFWSSMLDGHTALTSRSHTATGWGFMSDAPEQAAGGGGAALHAGLAPASGDTSHRKGRSPALGWQSLRQAQARAAGWQRVTSFGIGMSAVLGGTGRKGKMMNGLTRGDEECDNNISLLPSLSICRFQGDL